MTERSRLRRDPGEDAEVSQVRRAVLLLALVVAGGVVLHLVLLDGIHGNLGAILFGEDTQYAEGYSGARFRRVRVGMREEEVRALLGPPLAEGVARQDGSVVWRYSRSNRDSSYRIRAVRFVDGAVAGVYHEFYLD